MKENLANRVKMLKKLLILMSLQVKNKLKNVINGMLRLNSKRSNKVGQKQLNMRSKNKPNKVLQFKILKNQDRKVLLSESSLGKTSFHSTSAEESAKNESTFMKMIVYFIVFDYNYIHYNLHLSPSLSLLSAANTTLSHSPSLFLDS